MAHQQYNDMVAGVPRYELVDTLLEYVRVGGRLELGDPLALHDPADTLAPSLKLIYAVCDERLLLAGDEERACLAWERLERLDGVVLTDYLVLCRLGVCGSAAIVCRLLDRRRLHVLRLPVWCIHVRVS